MECSACEFLFFRPRCLFRHAECTLSNLNSFPPFRVCLPRHARPHTPSIPKRIRAHVRFLSLDLLEGRGPGTRGAELAAEYIATQFALAGVEAARRQRHLLPASPALRRAHRSKTRPSSPLCLASGAPVDLAYGTEIVAKDETGQTSADIDAPIVFVGYGIHAPEYNWDDYAGPTARIST